MVAVLVKALLNTQKRWNIITVDFVLHMLFATSGAYFIREDYAFDIRQYLPGWFGLSILCISVYFLLLQFYKFKPN